MDSVSIVSCESYDAKLVSKALLESLKNIDFKFKKGLMVLIKPNLLGPFKPQEAITTHPVVIEELCKILKQNKCKIFIGDSSADDTKKAFEVCGINKLKKYAKIINFESEEKVFFDLPCSKNVPFPKILFDVDLIINVAKLKTHQLTQVTLATKNLYGCIPGKLKGEYHSVFPNEKDFSSLVFEISKKVNPGLNIIDGIEGLEGNGPATGGTKIRSKVIFASKNHSSIDIVASNAIGFNPQKIITNKLSKKSIKDIKVLGNKDFKMKFKKSSMHNFAFLAPLMKLLPKKTIAFNDKCLKCHICEKKCPVNAITLKPYPECNSKKCILCLCCLEVCPNNAVYLKDPRLLRILKKLKSKLSKK
ncbi:MAG: DUF362 domain-containing protein [Candidatus Nanoarchaeia archaeon]